MTPDWLLLSQCFHYKLARFSVTVSYARKKVYELCLRIASQARECDCGAAAAAATGAQNFFNDKFRFRSIRFNQSQV